MHDQQIKITKEEMSSWFAIHLMGWIPARGNWWMEKGSPGSGEFGCDPQRATEWLESGERGVLYNETRYSSVYNTINWEPMSPYKAKSFFDLVKRVRRDHEITFALDGDKTVIKIGKRAKECTEGNEQQSFCELVFDIYSSTSRIPPLL